jgi:hypothetical protein
MMEFSTGVMEAEGAPGMRWDGKTARSFQLNEADENKAMKALLREHPIEEVASGFWPLNNTTQNLL